MAFLDTSLTVRYLTGTPPEMAVSAASVIDGLDGLQISGVAIAETAYVLTSVYRVPRLIMIDRLVSFIQKDNISTYALGKDLVLQALLMSRPSARVSVPDALIWAAARTAGDPVMYSFDERFPADGLEILRGLADQ